MAGCVARPGVRGAVLAGVVAVLAWAGSPRARADGAVPPGAVAPAAAVPAAKAAEAPVQALYAPEFRAVPVLLAALAAKGWPGVSAQAMGPWAEDVQPDGSRVRVPTRLLLEGLRSDVEQAGGWLAALDRPQPGVAVRVIVAELRRYGARETGGRLRLDRHATAAQDDTLLRDGSATLEPASWLRSALAHAAPFQGTSVTLGAFEHGHQAFAHTLRVLAQQQEADILAQGTLVATQGQPAELASQLRMPTTLLVEAQGPPGAERAPRYQGVTLDAGLALRLACLKAGEGQALLELSVTFSSAEPDPDPAAAPASLVLRSRRLETRVTVPHGHTVVLGGLSLTRHLADRRGIPLLDLLPALDGFLAARGGRQETTDLVFVLTPHLLEGPTKGRPAPQPADGAAPGPAGEAGQRATSPAPAAAPSQPAAPGARRRLAGVR